MADKVKDRLQDSQRVDQCLKEKQHQADKLRKEKKKIEKLKFKQEVQQVRMNMEKRDEIFHTSPKVVK